MKTNTTITTIDINVDFKQEGYGRQGLYVNNKKLMSIFPNFKEHFGLTQRDEAFEVFDENGVAIEGKYTDSDGNETEIFESVEQFMLDNYYNEILELLEE